MFSLPSFLRVPDVVKPRSVTVEMCSCWKSADWFDKMLGLQAGKGLPSVALCIGYQQGPGNTGQNLLTGWLMPLWGGLPGLSWLLEQRKKNTGHTGNTWTHGILTRHRVDTSVFANPGQQCHLEFVLTCMTSPKKTMYLFFWQIQNHQIWIWWFWICQKNSRIKWSFLGWSSCVIS